MCVLAAWLYDIIVVVGAHTSTFALYGNRLAKRHHHPETAMNSRARMPKTSTEPAPSSAAAATTTSTPEVVRVGAITSFLSGIFDSINIVSPVQCIYGSEVWRWRIFAFAQSNPRVTLHTAQLVLSYSALSLLASTLISPCSPNHLSPWLARTICS